MDNRDVERLLREAAARTEEAVAQIDQDALLARILARAQGETTTEPDRKPPSEAR